MRGGMFGVGVFLLLAGGFFSYEFYVLYQAVNSVIHSAGLTLIFGGEYATITNNVGYQLLHDLNLLSFRSNAPLTTIEWSFVVGAIVTIIGFVLLLKGATSKKHD